MLREEEIEPLVEEDNEREQPPNGEADDEDEGAVGPSQIPMLNPRHVSTDATDLTERQKRELRRLGHLDKQGLRVTQGQLPTKRPSVLRR